MKKEIVYIAIFSAFVIHCQAPSKNQIKHLECVSDSLPVENVQIFNKNQLQYFAVYDTSITYIWQRIKQKVSRNLEIDSSSLLVKEFGISKDNKYLICPMKKFSINDSLELYLVELYLKDSFPIFFKFAYAILQNPNQTQIYDKLLVYKDLYDVGTPSCNGYFFEYNNFEIKRFYRNCDNVNKISQEEFRIDTLQNKFR